MELQAERILPIPVDMEIINAAKITGINKANTVIEKQKFILKSKEEVNCIPYNLHNNTSMRI